MAVPAEKRSQTQRVAGVARSDQQSVADRVNDEVNAAKQECAQEYFTERRVRFQDMPQVRPSDFQKRTRFARAAPDQTTAARKLVHFTGELTAPQDLERRLATARNADDFDAAVRARQRYRGSRHPGRRVISPADACRCCPNSARRAICASSSVGNMAAVCSGVSGIVVVRTTAYQADQQIVCNIQRPWYSGIVLREETPYVVWDERNPAEFPGRGRGSSRAGSSGADRSGPGPFAGRDSISLTNEPLRTTLMLPSEVPAATATDPQYKIHFFIYSKEIPWYCLPSPVATFTRRPTIPKSSSTNLLLPILDKTLPKHSYFCKNH